MTTTQSALSEAPVPVLTTAERIRAYKRPLSIQQVAAELNKHISTIYRWVHSGKIPCHKLAGEFEFEPKTLARWVESKQSKLAVQFR